MTRLSPSNVSTFSIFPFSSSPRPSATQAGPSPGPLVPWLCARPRPRRTVSSASDPSPAEERRRVPAGAGAALRLSHSPGPLHGLSAASGWELPACLPLSLPPPVPRSRASAAFSWRGLPPPAESSGPVPGHRSLHCPAPSRAGAQGPLQDLQASHPPSTHRPPTAGTAFRTAKPPRSL